MKHFVSNKLFLSLVFALTRLFCFAQGADLNHPLLAKLPNYQVVHNETRFTDTDVPVSDVEISTIAGQRTYVAYSFNKNAKAIRPKSPQILQNFQDLVKGLGGAMTHKTYNFASYKVMLQEKEHWLVVETYNDGEEYSVLIIQREKLQEDIHAESILNQINSKGSLTLYISFPSGESLLPQSAQPIIEEIVKMLKKDPSVRLNIEGHTDNVGDPNANKRLSLERATSVMNALIVRGINKTRLNAIGWGSEKPIADNKTEKGRYQNRRVELVKVK
ncbi:MAG: OmpA family protein [Flammeovirgaceae bacterium]|nr:OmpA family protein [Flammeovirgaceae bacterium]MDW8286889.1 OmpA family protein [Flammeovirgaceae bacterium]